MSARLSWLTDCCLPEHPKIIFVQNPHHKIGKMVFQNFCQVGGGDKNFFSQIPVGTCLGIPQVNINTFWLTGFSVTSKKVSTGDKKRFSRFSTTAQRFTEVSNNHNFASSHARHLILVSNPRFLRMQNRLEPFS